MITPSSSTASFPQPPFRKIEKVEVAICTYNREKLLEKTLQSVQKLIVPYHVSLTVILVDNNSDDRTGEILKQFASNPAFTQRHSVRVLLESQQGHTFARNRAVDSLDGDLLIWTDDDVDLDAFLVQRYVDFANDNREVAFFGGSIEPDFETEPPAWILENWEQLKGCFATRELGPQSMSFDEDTLPYGANFAVRSCVQKRFAFETSLGRRGEEVLGEDELEMMRRLLQAGYAGRWVPEASVKHFIPADRATESYVRDYFLGQGRALVTKGEPWSDDHRALMWRALRAYLWYRFKRRFADSKDWIPLLMEHSLAQGQSDALKSR